MKINLTYSLNQKQLPVSYLQVMDSYGFASKNIYNSALFIVNNIFSSYVYDKESKTYKLKENLHDNQREVLKFINQAIEINNKKRDKNFPHKIEKYNVELTQYNNLSELEKLEAQQPKKPENKGFIEYTKEITKDIYYQVINKKSSHHCN